MYDKEDAGLDFMQGFALLAGLLWAGGGALLLIAVFIGRGMV